MVLIQPTKLWAVFIFSFVVFTVHIDKLTFQTMFCDWIFHCQGKSNIVVLQHNKVVNFHAKTLDYVLLHFTVTYKRQRTHESGKNHVLSSSYMYFVSFKSDSAFTIRKSRFIFGLVNKIFVQIHEFKMVKKLYKWARNPCIKYF